MQVPQGLRAGRRGGAGGGGGGGAHVHPNLHVTALDGSPEVMKVLDGLTYLQGPVKIGRAPEADQPDYPTSDPYHALFVSRRESGPYVAGEDLVDTFVTMVDVSATTPWDIGAVLGVVRARTGEVSARALAGQLFVYPATAPADSEAIEIGVHNAKTIISNADDPVGRQKFYGVTGILLLSYNGEIEPGVPAVRSNTAIVIGSIGAGAPSGFKQAVVYYDTDQTTKLWQVDALGNQLSGGGLSNPAYPSYSFPPDPDTGMYWGGTNTIGFAAGGVDRARVFADGFQISGAERNTALLSTPTLAGNTHDYIPAGLVSARVLLLQASTPVQLTGIVAPPQGTRLSLLNLAGNAITLVQESASSAVANRFSLPGGVNKVLGVNDSVTLVYIGSRWYAVD